MGGGGFPASFARHKAMLLCTATTHKISRVYDRPQPPSPTQIFPTNPLQNRAKDPEKEKEKKKAAKEDYAAARLAKAAERRSEEDAQAAKAAKMKYGYCHQHDFQSLTISPTHNAVATLCFMGVINLT